jgi:hypothetical protein
LTFAREESGGRVKAVAEVLHDCRNFEDIQRWAWDRRFHEGVDFSIEVGDMLDSSGQ